MTIIVDLDHMLINTELLKLKMRQALEPLGVSQILFESTYQQTVDRYDNRYSYDAQTHAELIAQSLGKPDITGQLTQRLYGAVDHTENLVYDDVREFLANARAVGASIILLTRGDDKWQNKKIDAGGLRELVDRVVVAPESKGEVLRSQLRPDPQTFFISDNAQEIEAIEGVPITMIQLLRPEGKYQSQAEGVPVCRSLNQVWDTIKQQSEAIL